MGAFDTVKSTQVPTPKEPIVKAKKILHKGYLMGHVSNGNGLVRLENGYAIKFIALDDKMVAVYLLDYGSGVEIAPQTWQKTKAIKEAKAVSTLAVKETAEEESLFD